MEGVTKIIEMVKSLEGIIAGLVFLFTSLIYFLKKMRLRERILHHYRKNKQLAGLREGSEINNIIAKLKNSGATYITIIRYHNGGPYKMSVEWEALGDPCTTCVHQCAVYGKLKPLQKDWQGIKVNNVWAEIIEKTISLDGKLNTKDMAWFDSDDVVDNHSQLDIDFNKNIWKAYGIDTFKEVLLSHKSGKQTMTLGLSFCARFSDYHGADIKMEMARRRLKELV
jgi:hypothetical protein